MWSLLGLKGLKRVRVTFKANGKSQIQVKNFPKSKMGK